MGGVSKVFKAVATGGASLIKSSGGSSSSGTSEQTTASAYAVSPTDITGNISGSEETKQSSTKKKKAGKKSLNVGTSRSGTNVTGSSKGLNIGG